LTSRSSRHAARATLPPFPTGRLRPGTKRVRQLGHWRARASTSRAVKPPDLQEESARSYPRVPYSSFQATASLTDPKKEIRRSFLVFPVNKPFLGSETGTEEGQKGQKEQICAQCKLGELTGSATPIPRCGSTSGVASRQPRRPRGEDRFGNLRSPLWQYLSTAFNSGTDGLLSDDHLVADRDRAAFEDVCSEPAAMHERTEESRSRELLQV
jgi:hypothetical protein